MAISTPNRATNGAPQTSAGIPRDLPEYVQDVVCKPGRLLIHGEWAEATTGKTVPEVHAPGAGWRRRADRPLELPVAAGGLEAWPGAGAGVTVVLKPTEQTPSRRCDSVI